ncbi:hypothetical protein A0H81_12036 [Grifola frondosa]|uniref:Uncharacterized protein n=1 Tax=Grifola frondosa TaxID=5627 RepID=A0A1C7LU51_GRIFR|nr:hypothetical protein A0H81_12036 [Grifola frondosa]
MISLILQKRGRLRSRTNEHLACASQIHLCDRGVSSIQSSASRRLGPPCINVATSRTIEEIVLRRVQQFTLHTSGLASSTPALSFAATSSSVHVN